MAAVFLPGKMEAEEGGRERGAWSREKEIHCTTEALLRVSQECGAFRRLGLMWVFVVIDAVFGPNAFYAQICHG